MKVKARSVVGISRRTNPFQKLQKNHFPSQMALVRHVSELTSISQGLLLWDQGSFKYLPITDLFQGSSEYLPSQDLVKECQGPLTPGVHHLWITDEDWCSGKKVSSCFCPKRCETACDLYFAFSNCFPGLLGQEYQLGFMPPWSIDDHWAWWDSRSHSDGVTIATSTVATFPLFKIPKGLSALEMSGGAPSSETLEKSRPPRALLSCWSVCKQTDGATDCNGLKMLSTIFKPWKTNRQTVQRIATSCNRLKIEQPSTAADFRPLRDAQCTPCSKQTHINRPF